MLNRVVMLAVGTVLLTGCAGPWSQQSAMVDPDQQAAPIAARNKKSTKKFSKDTEGYSRRLAQGRSLETAGKWDEARPIFEKLIVDYPDRPEAYHRLGVVADRRRRHREAQALYSEALRRKPNDAELFNDLGYCLFLQGQLDKAESAISKAVSLAPANPKYRNNLGLVYGHQDRIDDALEAFRRAGSEADAQYNMAFVLAAKNDIAGAKQRFHMALAADSTHEQSRKALRSFERAEADPSLLADDDSGPEGVRYVPYVEGESATSPSEIRTANATTGSTSSTPRTNPRSLQSQARQLMQQRMAAAQSQ